MPKPTRPLDPQVLPDYISAQPKPADKDAQGAKPEPYSIKPEPLSDERSDLILRLIVRLKTS